ncbi:hypothetical protein Ahy_B01g052669 isoform B [Arachis hypogaea]|uniref:Uncharacterized protein n=1 Tax=Arachis hypogaea TaxID=3818 RepID=A0A445AQ32_ARAHY|nr:hypothetical protein Ahy_B01g052669 isoform B [Arachis hypogaea]
MKYDSFVIDNDEDLQVLFYYRRQFFEVKTPELLAKFVDMVCNSGSSNRNVQSSAMPVCASSMPLSASSSVSVIAPEAVLVTSLSFTYVADLNHNRDREIGDNQPFGELAIAMASTIVMVPVFGDGGARDGVRMYCR